MSEIKAVLFSERNGAVTESLPDGDFNFLGLLDPREVRIIWAIVERAKKRRASEEKQRRIDELEAELAELRNAK